MSRRPVPTAVKIARGNPGHRALPKDEPTPPPASPDDDMPEGLSDDAKVYWRAVHKLLTDAQVISVMDVPALVLYSEAYARYRKAQKEMRKPGTGMVVRTPTGPRINPWQKILDKAHEQMLKICIEYGMTPSSRTRVTKIPSSSQQGQSGPRGSASVFSIVRGAK